MQRRLPSLVLFIAAIAATALYHPRNASATLPEGYKSTSLAMGRFGEIGGGPLGVDVHGPLTVHLPWTAFDGRAEGGVVVDEAAEVLWRAPLGQSTGA